jgi:AAA15 family ATPase/GTPase
MIAGSLKDHADTLVHNEAIPESILPAAALYGANASGKTNVLLALQFMARAVEFSHARWQPGAKIRREPFASAEQQDRASEFMVDFVMGGFRYQYGFSVSDTAVLEEWLHAYPKGKRQVWFRRRAGKPMSFSEKMAGENRTIEGLMRPNSLFLSTAAQNNHAALSPVYEWFSQSLKFVLGRRSEWKDSSADLCADSEHRDSIVNMISFADLGITDLKVSEEVIPEAAKRFISALETVIKSELKTALPDAELKFALADTNESRKQIRLLHRLGDNIVPFLPNQESDGTIAYLTLLGPIISALQTGGMVCVDELDASLHPLLAIHLIQLFGDKSLNPKGAQLIFNTHDTNLLSSGILRRDQIWFAEKKQDGSSQIYPLTDFKPRKEENLANGYLQGRYGAIPFLNQRCLQFDEEAEHEEA